MKVVLLVNVPSLGKKHDVVNVKDGYAINFLIPQRKAKTATEAAVREADSVRKKQVMRVEEVKAHEAEISQKVRDLKMISFKRKVSEKGHLFAAIGEKDIVEKLKEAMLMELPASSIEMKAHIKELGEHKVMIHVGSKKEELLVMVEKE